MSQALTPEETLQAASHAWQRAITAEHEISRLKRYRKLNQGMEADMVRHCQRLSDARLELCKLLNAASTPSSSASESTPKEIPYTTPSKNTGD